MTSAEAQSLAENIRATLNNLTQRELSAVSRARRHSA